MQTDMHYCGTYVMARCAGIEKDTAQAIAIAAEYVDDSDSLIVQLADGTPLVSEPTAHHPTNSQNLESIDQERTWVPFHFIPGGVGDTQERRLICRIDSELARAMVTRNIALANEIYGIPLVGITAHVYADTFAHYGFSGVSSPVNHVIADSIEFDSSRDEERAALREQQRLFKETYVSRFADFVSGLGHAGGATFPDQPYLRWRFTYSSGDRVAWRDNPVTFHNACQKLHEMFTLFNDVTKGDLSDPKSRVDFKDIASVVAEILATRADADGRLAAWNNAVMRGRLYPNPKGEPVPHYDSSRYLDHLRKLPGMTPDKARETLVYQFLQAANSHRKFVLDELLPERRITFGSSFTNWIRDKIAKGYGWLAGKELMVP